MVKGSATAKGGKVTKDTPVNPALVSMEALLTKKNVIAKAIVAKRRTLVSVFNTPEEKAEAIAKNKADKKAVQEEIKAAQAIIKTQEAVIKKQTAILHDLEKEHARFGGVAEGAKYCLQCKSWSKFKGPGGKKVCLDCDSLGLELAA